MASPNERHLLNLLHREYTNYRVIKERVNGEITGRLAGGLP